MVGRVKKRRVWGWVCLLILLVVGVSVFLNREWLHDFYRGMIYQPSDEMAQIRNDLNLTDRGEFLFNAVRPELDGAAEFNSYCRDGESEIAVLGCYTSGNIYVYNIVDKRLEGIRELTTAHELLHANYARMSESEKTELVADLTRVFDANRDLLEGEINTYDVSQKQEELYVRAGTEVKDLPEVLEKHYAEIFEEQDKIVGYYNSYISVFKSLETEMKGLKAEMETIKTELDTKMEEYEQKVTQLNAKIADFNNCAETAGCFASEFEFYGQRAELVTEQTALVELYNEINELVEVYNTKVEAYNADVLQNEKLNILINSAVQPQEIKQEENGQ